MMVLPLARPRTPHPSWTNSLVTNYQPNQYLPTHTHTHRACFSVVLITFMGAAVTVRVYICQFLFIRRHLFHPQGWKRILLRNDNDEDALCKLIALLHATQLNLIVWLEFAHSSRSVCLDANKFISMIKNAIILSFLPKYSCPSWSETTTHIRSVWIKDKGSILIASSIIPCFILRLYSICGQWNEKKTALISCEPIPMAN